MTVLFGGNYNMSLYGKMLIDSIAKNDSATYMKLMCGEHMNEVEVDAGSPAAFIGYLNSGNDCAASRWLKGDFDKNKKVVVKIRERQ